MTRAIAPIDISAIDAATGRLFSLAVEADLDGEVEPHHHARGQLLHVVGGALTIVAGGGLWTVPPRCALWIPPGVPHHGQAVGHIRVESLYVDQGVAAAMGDRCAILFIRPLLRELIVAYARDRALPRHDRAREDRLAAVLLDELTDAPCEPIHVPMPSDRRLRRMVEAMVADPAMRFTLAEWGTRIGASDRTLSRLFRQQTGLSFGRWRQQLHVSLALRRLAAGDPVSTIAGDSVSAFIVMFRRMLGTTPARYFD